MIKVDKKEIGISVVRSALSAVPYAGQLLNEIFFEYSGRIKQERLNKFTNFLSDFFLENQNINLENLKNEDFSDLLESILRKVVLTKSENKLKRFRDILVNKMLDSKILIENSDIYLDLVHTLSESEINILYHHRIFDSKFHDEKILNNKNRQELDTLTSDLKQEEKTKQNGYANNYEHMNHKILELKQLTLDYYIDTEKYNKLREASFYSLNDDKFIFYKQTLYSKGLLIDRGISTYSYIPFKLMGISEFGKEFIQFIIKS